MNKIITKLINKYEFNSKLFSNNEIKKITKDETIDDKEEYFDRKAIKIHDKQKNKPNFNDKANNIPKYVATPFPPLNLNQTGNICPRNAERPAK